MKPFIQGIVNRKIYKLQYLQYILQAVRLQIRNPILAE